MDIDSLPLMTIDRHQDIARHAFCDMVNDVDRNNKYSAAIERVVRIARERDGYAYVLDVGCGSGLLSMLALKYGANHVFGEYFVQKVIIILISFACLQPLNRTMTC